MSLFPLIVGEHTRDVGSGCLYSGRQFHVIWLHIPTWIASDGWPHAIDIVPGKGEGVSRRAGAGICAAAHRHRSRFETKLDVEQVKSGALPPGRIMQAEPRVAENEGETVADFLAAARAAVAAGDFERARTICLNLYRGLFEAAGDHAGFVNALMGTGLAETAEVLLRDFALALQQAGPTEALEVLLADATAWFADNPWFAAEYADLASRRGDFEGAAYRWEAVRSRWPNLAPGSLPVPLANEQAFVNVVAGLDVDEAAFQHEMARERPSSRTYIIVFTPRSGSSWLASILAATDSLGQPAEYLNPAFVRGAAHEMNSKDPSGLLGMLRRRRKSINGVFGIKVTAVDVVLYGEAEFFGAFDVDTVIFNLWRDNLVAQGISLYRAVTTGRFHSRGAAERAAEPPIYDPALIAQWVLHVANYENQNLLMLSRRGLHPRSLRYEDIVRSPATAVSIFADAMRVDVPVERAIASKAAKLRKIADDWNRTAELRFRQEEVEFVRSIEARRLIKREP